MDRTIEAVRRMGSTHHKIHRWAQPTLQAVEFYHEICLLGGEFPDAFALRDELYYACVTYLCGMQDAYRRFQ